MTNETLMEMKTLTALRKDFPFFSGENKNLHYLDSGATSLKPKPVIDTLTHYYENLGASVHRGAYRLGDKVTSLFEEARKMSLDFLKASEDWEVIFTSGTTDSLNLLAHSLGELEIGAGDEIVVTISEHHANFVPWQTLALKKGAQFKVIPLDKNYQIDLEEAKKLITKKTKILAFSHRSNVLGSLNPVKELMALAKDVGAYTVIDGAQGVPHGDVNVSDLDCDFYTFSAHKVLGPTGVGVLCGKRKILEKMPPYRTGGNMIAKVTLEKSNWNELPNKFEAGTPNIADVLALKACYEYWETFNRDEAARYENRLASLLRDELKSFKKIQTFNELPSSIVSFSHSEIHSHDIAFMADSMDVCIRSGHLCAQPLMSALGVSSLSRASFFFYNDEKDVEALIKSLHKAEKLFS